MQIGLNQAKIMTDLKFFDTAAALATALNTIVSALRLFAYKKSFQQTSAATVHILTAK